MMKYNFIFPTIKTLKHNSILILIQIYNEIKSSVEHIPHGLCTQLCNTFTTVASYNYYDIIVINAGSITSTVL